MSSIEKAIERLRTGGEPAKNGRVAPAATPLPDQTPPSDAHKKPTHHIDLEFLKRSLYLTPDQTRSTLGEQYRSIKRPLLRNARGRSAAPIERGNLIMVTSALPGEGKSFTAMNLAMSIALERDVTVLLVDSDVIKQSLSRLLGLQSHEGLIDVLVDNQVSLGDVIVNTDVPKLRVLPAGQMHLHSTELLASEGMQRLTDELAERYSDRIVVFDGPPLLATTEAAVVAHFVGQVVLVVEAGRTPPQVVADAVATIGSDQVVGTVLNKSRTSLGGDQYGEYYGAYGD